LHSGAQEIQAVAFKFYWDKPESAVFAAPSLALIWVQPVGGGLIADANGVGDLREGAFLRSLKLQGAYHAAASFFVRAAGGFSGDSEPSDVRDKAFADAAAVGSSRRPRH
jgi:hypothetical protein